MDVSGGSTQLVAAQALLGHPTGSGKGGQPETRTQGRKWGAEVTVTGNTCNASHIIVSTGTVDPCDNSMSCIPFLAFKEGLTWLTELPFDSSHNQIQ
jgi:hypothetical protein